MMKLEHYYYYYYDFHCDIFLFPAPLRCENATSLMSMIDHHLLWPFKIVEIRPSVRAEVKPRLFNPYTFYRYTVIDRLADEHVQFSRYDWNDVEPYSFIFSLCVTSMLACFIVFCGAWDALYLFFCLKDQRVGHSGILRLQIHWTPLTLLVCPSWATVGTWWCNMVHPMGSFSGNEISNKKINIIFYLFLPIDSPKSYTLVL